MTGQGSAHVQHDGTSVAVELRTVNNRYYKLSLRVTDGLSPLESRIDEVVRQTVRRGTVQADVRVDRQAAAEDYQLNETALAAYLRQIQDLNARWRIEGTVRLDALLALPGVVNERAATVDFDALWPIVEQALHQALRELTRMREGEGGAMAADLVENCRVIATELDAIEALAPRVAESYRVRLVERLNNLLAEFGVSVQASDVVREVGMFAERSDIAEEVVRLRSHLSQFQTIMDTVDGSGRRLDFVTQEMFREANTIGSKANDAQIARHVVEIKAAIERIREMVQNIE